MKKVDPLRLSEWKRAHVFADPKVPIAVIEVNEHPDLRTHHHAFTEVVFVVEGIGEHLFAGRKRSIGAGEVLVVNEGQDHAYSNTKGLRIINLLFDEKYLLSRLPFLKRIDGYRTFFHMKPEFPLLYASGQRVWFPAKEMNRILGVLRALVGELGRQDSGWEAMSLALVQQIVVSICRIFVRTPLPPEEHLTGVGAALSHIENHFDEVIDLKKLEQVSRLTARTLLRHCETATGHSPMQYLHRVRLNEACRLLKQTDISVTEIAFRVGFQDSNYFTRCFRKIIGESPSSYRRGC